MKWTGLTEEQFNRLCNCRSRKSDIIPIARCYKDEDNLSPCDALIATLEHLDCNGQFFDIGEVEFCRMVTRI